MAVNGVVGVSCGELGRYSVFYDSLFGLECPAGTVVKQARGANIAENRNNLTRFALGVEAQWVLYLDDDGILPPEILNHLLAHDKPVVSALYLQRHPPFQPHMFDREDEKGRMRARLLQPWDKGLVKVLGAGAGCLLVRSAVLRAMTEPWWTLGQIEPNHWGDDLDFCRRVRLGGFEIFCDLDAALGHQCNATVWPRRTPEGWVTTLVQDGPIAQWPAAHRPGDIEVIQKIP